MKKIILIILIIVTALLCVFGLLFVFRILETPEGYIKEALRRLKKKTISNLDRKKTLTKMFERFVNHFSEYTISIWPEFGTLLGIVREKDIICYDGDVDFSCLLSEWSSIKNIVKKFVAKYKNYHYISLDFFDMKGVSSSLIENITFTSTSFRGKIRKAFNC